jgi:hypothetical protein
VASDFEQGSSTARGWLRVRPFPRDVLSVPNAGAYRGTIVGISRILRGSTNVVTTTNKSVMRDREGC